jgi:hypothetical protein
MHKNRRVVFIGSASSDWQRLPNYLKRIHERIQEHNPNGADLIVLND